MEEIIINADRRQIIGKHVKTLRREGKLPAVVYGKNLDSIPITLDYRESSRILDKLSPSALVLLKVDDEDHYTLVREKQRNPILGSIRHVDFEAVSLTETVRSNVNVRLIGEAPAVEDYLGILVTSLEQLEVESLPRALPDIIEVDVSVLKEIGDSLTVKDLVMPEGVEVLHEPDEVIVVVTAPVMEPEEEVEEVEEVEEGEPQVIERGRREVESEEES
jgi:large subunit ribosomal protein L25